MPPRKNYVKKNRSRPTVSSLRLRGMRDVQCPRCGLFKSGMSEEYDELAIIRHTAKVGCDKLPLVRLPVLPIPPTNNKFEDRNSFLPAGEPSISVFEAPENADMDDMNDLVNSAASPYENEEEMLPRKLLVEKVDVSGFVAPSDFDEETPEQTSSD